MVEGGQRDALAAWPTGKRSVTNYTGGRVVPMAGLYVFAKYRLQRDSIAGPSNP
jgi:hypothetical protein